MNNLSDKNWDALGKEVASYEANEYSANDWTEMEQMLYPTTSPSTINNLQGLYPYIISFAAIIAAVVLLSQFNSNTATSNVNATETSQIDNTPTPNKNNLGVVAASNTKESTSIKKSQDGITTQVNESNIEKEQAPIKSIKDKVEKTANKIDNTKRLVQDKLNTARAESNLIINNGQGRNQSPSEIKNATETNTQNLLPTTTNTIDSQNAIKNIIQEENTKIIANESANKNFETSNLTLMPTIAMNNIATEDNPPAGAFDMIETNKVDKRIKFGLQIGLNNSITDYSSLTTSHLPYFGLFVKKRLSEKWGIELGAQIKTVDNFNLVQSRRSEWFDHNGLAGYQERSIENVGYRSLDIPLTFSYKISNRLRLSLGARYSYLQTNIENRRSFSANFGGSSAIQDSSEFDKGFWEHDFGIVLGAEYQISNKWLVSLQWNQGIRDISPDNLYQNDTRVHSNSDLQVSFKYLIF